MARQSPVEARPVDASPVDASPVEPAGLGREHRHLALENGRLRRELARERARLGEAQEAMRRKLARDLHDGPAQAVATLAMHLDYLRRLAEQGDPRVGAELDAARGQAVRISRDLRNLLFELRPLVLETRGLLPALESLVGRAGSGSGLGGHLDVRGAPVPLPVDAELAAFAIVQEAIGNARKHARAANFWVEIDWQAIGLRIRVRDDGCGFDVASLERDYEARGSYGFRSMQERAELIGAQFCLTSAPGVGTVVALDIPLGAPAPRASPRGRA